MDENRNVTSRVNLSMHFYTSLIFAKLAHG